MATDPQQNLPLSWHSQKPVSKVSLVPARCQNVFPFSVPRGGGFTTHLSSGTLDTGLEFDTLHWRQKLLLELTTVSQSSILSRFWFQNDLQNSPWTRHGQPGRPCWRFFGGLENQTKKHEKMETREHAGVIRHGPCGSFKENLRPATSNLRPATCKTCKTRTCETCLPTLGHSTGALRARWRI